MDAQGRVVIPFQGRRVEAVRCTATDVNVLADWCDLHLGRDYFFRRRHVESILQRTTNAVYGIVVDGEMAGLLILYKGSELHNFYLDQVFRAGGLGSAILEFFKPRRIRSKTNMLAGDPTPFYEKNGYVVDQPDPDRPHIIDMVRAPEAPALSDGESDSLGNDATPTSPAKGAQELQVPAHVQKELDSLRKKEANRQRAKDYRSRVKAEIAAGTRQPRSLNGHASTLTSPADSGPGLYDPLAPSDN